MLISGVMNKNLGVSLLRGGGGRGSPIGGAISKFLVGGGGTSLVTPVEKRKPVVSLPKKKCERF